MVASRGYTTGEARSYMDFFTCANMSQKSMALIVTNDPCTHIYIFGCCRMEGNSTSLSFPLFLFGLELSSRGDRSSLEQHRGDLMVVDIFLRGRQRKEIDTVT